MLCAEELREESLGVSSCESGGVGLEKDEYLDEGGLGVGEKGAGRSSRRSDAAASLGSGKAVEEGRRGEGELSISLRSPRGFRRTGVRVSPLVILGLVEDFNPSAGMDSAVVLVDGRKTVLSPFASRMRTAPWSCLLSNSLLCSYLDEATVEGPLPSETRSNPTSEVGESG